MTTGELHGVSYVTETMFQNVTAYALYEPRCAHGKDDGCHGEQRHQVGHYYGAAGQGSVAAHLVCDDVDIDGGRHGADDDQGDQLLRRKAGGDPHGSPDGRHQQQLDTAETHEQRQIVLQGTETDASAHHQQRHGIGGGLEIAQALRDHEGQLDLEIGEGDGCKHSQDHGVFQNVQKHGGQAEPALALLDSHQNNALNIVKGDHQRQDQRCAGHMGDSIDISQKSRAQIDEIAPVGGMGKGALLAAVRTQQPAGCPGQRELQHHAARCHRDISDVKGGAEIAGGDVQKHFSRQQYVVHQIGGMGNVILCEKPLVGENTAQPHDDEEGQAHIEAEQQILQQNRFLLSRGVQHRVKIIKQFSCRLFQWSGSSPGPWQFPDVRGGFKPSFSSFRYRVERWSSIFPAAFRRSPPQDATMAERYSRS